MKENNPKLSNKIKSFTSTLQNHAAKNGKLFSNNCTTTNSTTSSRWGSNIVKGFSGDRKPSKKILGLSDDKRVKRGLMSEMSCSVAPTQVHPHGGSTKLSSSRDLFVEIEQLRVLLKESKTRECELRGEVEGLRRNDRVKELEREAVARKAEVQELLDKVKVVEGEALTGGVNKSDRCGVGRAKGKITPQMELVQLKRVNKELQLQKRDLATRLAALVSHLHDLTHSNQCESITKVKAEASSLRRTNEDLCKQVEGLQKSRLNEVEELAYLRWVNSQLRSELRDSSLPSGCDVRSTPLSSPHPTKIRSSSGYCRVSDEFLECSSAKRLSVVKKLNKWPVSDEDLSSLDSPNQLLLKRWEELDECSRRHSISGSKSSDEELVINRRQSDGIICLKEVEFKETHLCTQKLNANFKVLAPTEVVRRALRIPNPPPRPSCANTSTEVSEQRTPVAPPPPPPPPPPPRFLAGSTSCAVQRAPEVVEFYHSLMKRDMKRDSTGGAATDNPDISSVRSNMIDEIENRSSYLLAIKADVETQGEFVNSLIREVNYAVYQNIEDVVAFVKWLDDELCFLVDERAVLKHFDWPEKKADTLREAAFGYKDLKKLESEVTYYKDDPRLPCDLALKKMVSLSEKIECTIYNLVRTRDTLMRRCKEFQIPVEWMHDSGIVSKVKLGSVKLAKKYMNRVAFELQSGSTLEKDPALDYMLLQGVRFAFRIHQFVGGFDAETMEAFEELRTLAHYLNK